MVIVLSKHNMLLNPEYSLIQNTFYEFVEYLYLKKQLELSLI